MPIITDELDKSVPAEIAYYPPILELESEEKRYYDIMIMTVDNDFRPLPAIRTIVSNWAKAQVLVDKMSEQVNKDGVVLYTDRGNMVAHPMLNQLKSWMSYQMRLLKNCGALPSFLPQERDTKRAVTAGYINEDMTHQEIELLAGHDGYKVAAE